MYVIGHLYYLELTEKLPLHANAMTRLFKPVTRLQYFRLFKISVIKGMKILFVKKMHCLIFPCFSQLSFSGASKMLSCGNVPDGG